MDTYSLTGRFDIIKQLLPRTFAFKTREGGIGILQILNFGKKKMRIQYKMIEPLVSQKATVQVDDKSLKK